jgi:uncharacterized membrane-anchored protein
MIAVVRAPALLLLTLAVAPAAFASDEQNSAPAPAQTTVERLNAQGSIALPPGVQFAGRSEGLSQMRAMGHSRPSGFIGLLSPNNGGAGWWATVVYRSPGHIREDEAALGRPGELLKRLQSAILDANAGRAAHGAPPLEVKGWLEPPFYDRPSHTLVWAAQPTVIGAAHGGAIGYHTVALGRSGYYQIDFVILSAKLEAAKAAARELIAATRFDPGQGYDDFDASKDSDAALSLSDLVVGQARGGTLYPLRLQIGAAISFAIVGLALALRRFAARRRVMFPA